MPKTFGRFNKGTQNQFQNNLHCSLVHSAMYVQISSTFIDTNTVESHVDNHKHKLSEEM